MKAIFHREAEGEFRSAIAYYDRQRPGLGTEFRNALERAVGQIARMPQASAPHGDSGLRKHILHRFPYAIFYLPFQDRIWIAAVAHQRRRPDYWENRRFEPKPF